ncbi:ribosomal protein L2 [Cardiosporidium cionae]|uniref:Ribosomal protein L2 n=1 Tax=Cardiosporidium cionae TaxID=476202 RepID=A0ABQ7J610_9APIC|nr:ribosomal protein L2 [Cardiosporidium cionae]|eukprot:KAF8819422.1 ribosomal protein L2 [Cardiosporidium cionae]
MMLKILINNWKKASGRNNTGKITSRSRGAGHKQQYRILNMKYAQYGLLSSLAMLIAKHYDPYRNAYIGLIKYLNGNYAGKLNYMLYPDSLQLNALISFNINTKNVIGSSKQLKFILIGSVICNLELYKGQGSQISKAAGTHSTLLALDGKYACIKLPSQEVRLISKECFATLGRINVDKFDGGRPNKRLAGRSRHCNIRPTVRGVAKNACDHPHGGGEGRSGIGRKCIYTPWQRVKCKTRSKSKSSTKLILTRKH